MTNKAWSPISTYNLIIYFWPIKDINFQLFPHLLVIDSLNFTLQGTSIIFLISSKKNFCYTVAQQMWALCTWTMIMLWSRMIWKHQPKSVSIVGGTGKTLIILYFMQGFYYFCTQSLHSWTQFYFILTWGAKLSSWSRTQSPLRVSRDFLFMTIRSACESTWIPPVPSTWNSLLQNVHLPRYLFEPDFSLGRDNSHCLQYLVCCLGIVN